jgi:predicted methyltransferase
MTRKPRKKLGRTRIEVDVFKFLKPGEVLSIEEFAGLSGLTGKTARNRLLEFEADGIIRREYGRRRHTNALCFRLAAERPVRNAEGNDLLRQCFFEMCRRGNGSNIGVAA